MKRQKIKEFFKQDTILLAKKLLGKLILIKKDGKILGGYIVETEAYLGTEDKACHSFEEKEHLKLRLYLEKQEQFTSIQCTLIKC